MTSAERALTLADLVANRTMPEEVATTLRAAAARRDSFVVTAVPRFAGKSTVMGAMLAHAPRAAPVRMLGFDGADLEALIAQGRGGYLVIPEISRGAWGPGYIWGAPVRRAFRAIAEGVALAAALHAADLEETLAIICRGNGVSDADASGLALVVHLRSLGSDPERPDRRVVASVHRIAQVRAGRPEAFLLHRWDERADRFETLARG